jgi:hypothetical protein
MPTLRPYRNYSEKDVINNASFSGAIPATRGTLVKYVQGFVATDEPIEMIGSVGASYNNTVSQRYGAYAKVAACGAGEAALGFLLMDVRETDENGEQLKFNPRKAAEMDCVTSGQAVPVVTKGEFHYSGVLLASQTPAAHTKLYAGPSGELTTGQVWGALGSGTISGVTSPQVGYCLGGKDTNGCVMIRLNVV